MWLFKVLKLSRADYTWITLRFISQQGKKVPMEAIKPLLLSLISSRSLSCAALRLNPHFHHAIILFKVSPQSISKRSNMHLLNKQIFSDYYMPGARDINMTKAWLCNCGVHLLVGRQTHKQIITEWSRRSNDASAYKVLWEQR